MEEEIFLKVKEGMTQCYQDTPIFDPVSFQISFRSEFQGQVSY